MAEPVLNDLTVVVLAAGGGTRMRSKTPKMLHALGGRSLLGHVLAAVAETSPRSVVAVVGHQRELVGPHVSGLMPDCLLAVQEEQKGTGHALRVGVEAAKISSGTVLVALGDTPLLTGRSLRDFVAEHEAAQRAVSLLSGDVADPTGYGRVVRDEDGEVLAIIEHKDASPEQLELTEINSGIMAFEAGFLLDALPGLGND
ncbi:MAG: NTP transferase domain-containing protein, partial [Nocardioides sp.]